MNELDRFEELFLLALSAVHPSYFQTTYNNFENIKNAFHGRLGRFKQNNFERYGERIFCYELYHQLRKLIELEKIENPLFLGNALLQGEVEKMQIIELVEQFNLEQLGGEYIPDFLVHTPGSPEYHAFVIEVKCDHRITGQKIFGDLLKINEFITRYHYQRGIFLTVNSTVERIISIINELNHQIQDLAGLGSIKVICKPSQDQESIILQL